MAKAAAAALCLIEGVHGLPFDAFVACNDELRDAVAIVDREGRVGEVGENDTDLSAVIGVDRAGRVQYSEAVLNGQPAAWADLRLIAGWEFERIPVGISARCMGASVTGASSEA